MGVVDADQPFVGAGIIATFESGVLFLLSLTARLIAL
jgi:hypothetical protein